MTSEGPADDATASGGDRGAASGAAGEPGASGAVDGGRAPGAGGPSDAGDDQLARVLVYVRGRVQGVGFRWWTRATALELGLVGHARNTDDGRVEIVAEGRRPQVRRLLELLTEDPSTRGRPGRVTSVSQGQWGPPRHDATGFVER